jgi:DNA repair exonuclease SbcCD nuclease subunit
MSDNYAIFSDLHLGVHQNGSNWHKIANDWSDWFVDDLKKRNIKKILFLGDYFHSRSDISVNTLHVASDIINKFEDFELKMIVGNHCSFYKDKPDIHSLSIFKGYGNIEIVDKPKMFNFDGKNVFMCPWGVEYSQIEECDVLMGHFEIQSFKMNTYKLCEHGFSSTDLGKKASLIFSGHFHLRDEREYKNHKIIYVGNPFEMDYGDENSTKGYYVMNFNSMEYKFIENTLSPKHKKIKLSEFKESENIQISNNIVKLIIDEKIEIEYLDKISTNIKQLKPNALSFDNSIAFTPKIDLDDECDLSGVDMVKAISDFVDLLDIQDKEAVVKYTVDLYKSI